MKKFDLEAARRGAAVCQADGRDVFLVGISIETNAICGYTLPMAHGIWDLDGNGYSGSDFVRLMMRDDDYVERLAQGEYPTLDGGFILEDPQTDEPKEEQPDAEQEPTTKTAPNEEKTYVSSPNVPDSAAYGAILGALFGSPFTSATRLRINIEYDGNPVRFDVEKALTYLQSTLPPSSAPKPSPKQEA